MDKRWSTSNYKSENEYEEDDASLPPTTHSQALIYVNGLLDYLEYLSDSLLCYVQISLSHYLKNYQLMNSVVNWYQILNKIYKVTLYIGM